jgi:hypothetical protein
MRVFMCYSREDRDFVDVLADDLRRAGVPIWRDMDDIPVDVAANTVSWRNAVDRALRECTHMIVVLSPDAVASAEVQAEWNYFLGQRRPVYPVLYRDADIPYRLYTLQLWDMRDAYEPVLDHLIGLLPEGEGEPIPPARHTHAGIEHPEPEETETPLSHVVRGVTEQVRARPLVSAFLAVGVLVIMAILLAGQLGFPPTDPGGGGSETPGGPTATTAPNVTPSATPVLEPDQVLGPIAVDGEEFPVGETVTVRVRRGRSVSTVLCVTVRQATNRSVNLGAPNTITPIDEFTFEDVYTFSPEVADTYEVRCSGVASSETGQLRVTASPIQLTASFILSDLTPAQQLGTLTIDRTAQHEVGDPITIRIVRGLSVNDTTCFWVLNDSSENGTLDFGSSNPLDADSSEDIYTFTPPLSGTYTVRCSGVVNLAEENRVVGTASESFYVANELLPAEQLGPIRLDRSDYQVGDSVMIRLLVGNAVSDLTCSWAVQDTQESSELTPLVFATLNDDQFQSIYSLVPEIGGRYTVNCSGSAATESGLIPVSVTLPFDIQGLDNGRDG